MQAAVGRAQLAKLPEFVRLRRDHHRRLSDLLAPLAGLLLQQEPTTGSEPSWFGLLLTLTDEAKAAGLTRDDVVAHVEAGLIQTRMLFGGNMVRQPCFDSMREAAEMGRSDARYRVFGDLAVTDRFMEDSFWVGVYPGLNPEMIDYVGQTITSAVGGSP